MTGAPRSFLASVKRGERMIARGPRGKAIGRVPDIRIDREMERREAAKATEDLRMHLATFFELRDAAKRRFDHFVRGEYIG